MHETHMVTYYHNLYKSRGAKLKVSPPPLLIGKKSLLLGKKGLVFAERASSVSDRIHHSFTSWCRFVSSFSKVCFETYFRVNSNNM